MHSALFDIGALSSGLFIESQNKISPGSILNKRRVNAGFIKGFQVLLIESQFVNQYLALVRQQRLCLDGIVIPKNDLQVLRSKISGGVIGPARDGASKPIGCGTAFDDDSSIANPL
jgi:hypothetical protein